MAFNPTGFPLPRLESPMGLPLYHDDKMIVKLRPTVRPAVTVLAALGGGHESAAETLESPALSMLATFQRAGLIKRVTPVAPAVADGGRGPTFLGGHGMLAALTASLAPPEKSTVAGVSIIDLEPGADLSRLRMSLASDPHVDYISRVPVRYLFGRKKATKAATRRKATRSKRAPAITIAATPPPASTMWNLKKIHWDEARAIPGFDDAAQIRVAVLDSGIDINHPDLQGHIGDYSYDYPDLPNAPSAQDVIGHGTHVSGTISALVNDFGIDGICSAQIYMHKIFPDHKEDTVYDDGHDYWTYAVDPVMYLRSLEAARQQGVQALNLSIGGYGVPSVAELDAFRALLADGVAVVAAMGNDNTGRLSYPAAIPGVIAVGSTSIDDTRSQFSNFGQHIALCAPGEGIWSTLPTYPGNLGYRNSPGPHGEPRPGTPIPRPGGTNYAAWQGTSMATPHVTAACALLVANGGPNNGAAIRDKLMATADKVSGMQGATFTVYYGSGRLNLYRLLTE